MKQDKEEEKEEEYKQKKVTHLDSKKFQAHEQTDDTLCSIGSLVPQLQLFQLTHKLLADHQKSEMEWKHTNLII